MIQDLSKERLINGTIELWHEKFGREITQEEAALILKDLTAFGKLLLKANSFLKNKKPSYQPEIEVPGQKPGKNIKGVLHE